MLRDRVFGVSFVVVLLIALLELSGLLVGHKLDGAVREQIEWGHQSQLNLEFDGFIVRAAGEGVSAFLTGSEAFAEEALEALAEAGERLEDLRLAHSGVSALDTLAQQLRARQEHIQGVLSAALAPLESAEGLASLDALDRAQAVYAYEGELPEMRRLAGSFALDASELSDARVRHWRRVSDGLSIARLLALTALVIALTRVLQNRIVAPVTEMAEAAQQVSCGEFKTAVSERGDGEIGSLQRAFNGMVRRLDEFCEEAKTREDALREALNRAEDASAAKTAFVASVSHELRTPMHGVLGTADMLLRSELDPSVRKGIQTIRASSEALLAIINDVLDLSKLEAGRMEIRFGPVDLRKLLAECLALVESRAMQHGLALHSRIDEGVPQWFAGDAGRLRQVLMNLLGNAVKFTERGNVRFEVAPSLSDPGRLRFEVADTGPGIPVEAMERIFMPFEQADGSISRKHGGTGLGLAISGLLVEAMGGKLVARNRDSGGAEFSFELPATACEAPVEVASETTVRSAGFKGHVLVVEDHPVNQTLAEAMLAELGCSCDLAADGAVAISAAATKRYDLILMDCQMPNVDGFTATRAIRSAEADGDHRRVIVAMTAGAMQSDRDAAQSAGMDDFLAKPFTLDELRGVLARWLEPRG